MTAADLSHENLALLEAKLRADLAKVIEVRALFREHLGSAAQVRGVTGQPTQSVVGPPAAALAKPFMVEGPLGLIVPDVKVIVAEALKALNGNFKIGDVKEEMRKIGWGHYPDTSVRSVLMRMVQIGQLKLVEQAIGRGGNTFGRVNQQVTDAENEAEPVVS